MGDQATVDSEHGRGGVGTFDDRHRVRAPDDHDAGFFGGHQQGPAQHLGRQVNAFRAHARLIVSNPLSSMVAPQPGGTTTVVSSSSMITGPSSDSCARRHTGVSTNPTPAKCTGRLVTTSEL